MASEAKQLLRPEDVPPRVETVRLGNCMRSFMIIPKARSRKTFAFGLRM